MNLYNILRPKHFKDLLSTCDSIEAIKNDAISKTLKHTYMLHGPRGCGKTTVAKLIAMSYSCEADENIPCGECKPCRDNKSAYSSIIEVNGGDFRKIENMRDLLARYSKKALFEKTAVIIINECHKLSPDAKDLLLVPLEEPPKHLKWILTTTEIGKMGDALISRCQVHRFKQMSSDDTKRLVSITIDKYCELIGGVKDGVVILDDISQKVHEASSGIPRTAIGMVEAYLASGLNESVLYAIHSGGNSDTLTEEERSRFDMILNMAGCTDVIEAAIIAQKLMNFSGEAEGIRLGLIKYAINGLTSLSVCSTKEGPLGSIGRARNAIQLLKLIRQPLEQIYPMRDLLCRLIEYVDTKSNNGR